LSSPDHKKTYRSEAEKYDLLISREDYQGNLIREIERIRVPDGLDIVDLGAGTGRLSLLLASRSASLIALDIATRMLQSANHKLLGSGVKKFLTAAGDHRALPLSDGVSDLVISGWSVCYLVDWYPASWKKELDKAFMEIERIVRPGGTILLIETQGTGYSSPYPPPHLENYFKYLEDAGFTFSWIRTDYKFMNLEEAVTITKYFFGEELAKKVTEQNWVILPECTGFWEKNLT
jgi:ubiquinone/menaquinone biosynthesis C-methylase UbiE